MTGVLPVLRLLLAIVTVASLALTPGCRPRSTAPRIEPTERRIAFRIGETTIYAYVTEVGSNPLTMVHLHEDERTAAEAGRHILQKQGGRLIQLVHSGRRRVTFTWEGSSYSFDPNRIFSKAGVRQTVRGTAPIPDMVYSAVDEFASRFIQYFALEKQRFLIALHNNGEGYYSIESYLPDEEYGIDAAKCFVTPEADADDFYYVTTECYFTGLRKRDFNVVLQDNRISRDDGSLSVFVARRGIPYINVEAQNGHLPEQVRMIEVAIRVAKSYGS